MNIHQPSSTLYSMFNNLILLAEGRIIYSGPLSGVADHFASLGFVCPPGLYIYIYTHTHTHTHTDIYIYIYIYIYREREREREKREKHTQIYIYIYIYIYIEREREREREKEKNREERGELFIQALYLVLQTILLH